MLEHGRVSRQQMMWLYASCLLGASLLILPQIIAVKAKQDSWITTLLGGIIGVLFLLLWTALASRYPNKNFAEYTMEVFGRPLGTALLLPYVTYILWVVFAMQRETVDFFAINYPETPVEFTTLCFSLVVIVVLLQGLEGIARTNDILLPFILFIILGLVLVALHGFSFSVFMPMLTSGIRPVIDALKVHLSFPYGNAVVFLMIFPYIRSTKDLRYASISGSLLGTFILLIVIVFTLFSIGPASMARVVYPPHFAARTVTVASFVAGLDGLVDIAWIASNTIRITAFTYGAVLCLSHMLKMSSQKYLIIPVVALNTIGSLLIYRSVTEQAVFNEMWIPSSTIYVTLGLPVLVLLVSIFRKKREVTTTS